MKTCGYCGNEYDDKEPKCPQCGATFLKHTKGAESAAEERERLKEEMNRKRKIRSIILGIGAAAIVLVIVIIISNIVGFVNDPQRDIAKESKELISQAEQQMNSGNYDKALDTLDRIDTAWEDYDKVDDVRLEAVKGQLEAKLEEYESAGNYQAIIAMINENVTDINADAEVNATYERAVQNYKAEAISSAEEFAEIGDYASARSALTVALNFIGHDVEISAKLKEVNQKEVLDVVLSFEGNGNYKDAIIYMNEHSDVVSGDTALQQKLSTYTEIYCENAIGEAASAYKSGGHTAALSVLNSALKVLPGNGALSNEKVKYEQTAPISLTNMDCTKQGEYVEVGPYKDNFNKDVNGNSYTNSGVHCFYTYKSGGLHDGDSLRSITYFLDQNYDVLTGVLYRPYSTLSCEFEWSTDGKVEIYGDGILLYEGKVSQKTYDTLSLNVDITGVRELTFIFRGALKVETSNYGMYEWHPKCCLADLMVAKEP